MPNDPAPPKAQFPLGAVNAATDSDLNPPLRSLLEEINVLETVVDERKNAGTGPLSTPWSMQVITAGATGLTKVISTLVATFGGTAAIWAAVKGFWLTSPQDQRLAYVGAAAAIVSALAIALAVIVKADVAARATASAAQYDARRDITTAFLQAVQPLTAAQYVVRRGAEEAWIPVEEFTMDGQSIVAVTARDRIRMSDLTAVGRLNGHS